MQAKPFPKKWETYVYCVNVTHDFSQLTTATKVALGFYLTGNSATLKTLHFPKIGRFFFKEPKVPYKKCIEKLL